MLGLGDGEFEQLDRKAQRCVTAFFHNTWFSRSWVQQELGLNENDTFCWGISTNPCETVIAFFPQSRSRKIQMQMATDQCRFDIRDMRHVSIGAILPHADDANLIQQPTATCDRPTRLRVFISRYPTICDLRVTPNYNKSVDEVYLDFTVALLTRGLESPNKNWPSGSL